jgi:hypothetical protein
MAYKIIFRCKIMFEKGDLYNQNLTNVLQKPTNDS